MALAAQAMTVGIVGLGALGSAIATALIAHDQHPIGYDRDADALARFAAAGGTPAASAAELCRTANCVIVVLRDELQIEDLLAAPGVLAKGIQAGTTLWLVSTVRPAFAAHLGEILMQRQVHLLDGPVSGGVELARAGQLTLILAGDDAAFAAVSSLTPAVAARVFRVADRPGPASAVKAINQLLAASHIALAAEALGLALHSGVDPWVLYEAVNVSSGASRMFANRVPRMIEEDFSANATIGIFLKDLSIALDMGLANGSELPVAKAAYRVFQKAAESVGANTGDPAIFRLYAPARTQAEP